MSWLGIGLVEVPGASLALRPHVGPGASAGAPDVPDQLVVGTPLGELHQDHAGVVRFTVPAVPSGPVLTEKQTGVSIVGVRSQHGQHLPYRPDKDSTARTHHPQLPRKPMPYQQEKLPAPPAAVDLSGTLTAPETPHPSPAVVLITGNGIHDRDETDAGHKPFLVTGALQHRPVP